MEAIGIIGGMSCESTALYYQRLNAEARRRLGGLHSAEVLIWSVDFAPVARMQTEGRWDDAGDRLVDIARRLERAGAGLILLATNTMHRLADRVAAAISVPLLHIADATARRITQRGLQRPGLMATRYTMEQDFYTGRMRRKFGLDVAIPSEPDRETTHRVIYEELCKGIVEPRSRRAFEEIAERLVQGGCDCLVLGCTEVGMLLDAKNVSVPVFDTMTIHADAALDWALATEPAPSRAM